MRLLFLGTPPFAVPTLEKLLQSRHRVLAVLTQLDRPRGRSRQVEPPPVKKIAAAAGVPVLQPEDPRQPAFLNSLRHLLADCAVVVAYGRLLPPEFLELFPKGVINLHASLLPKYRGAAPIQWALIRGDIETGVTVFQLDQKLDHGPILLKKPIPIEPDEDAVGLAKRLARLGADAVLEALDQIEAGQAQPVPQEDSEATEAPRLTKVDGILPWDMDCVSLYNRVRGMQPWPGATTRLEMAADDKPALLSLKILSVHPDPQRNRPGTPPGTILSADPKAGLWVQTGKGQLRIDRLQPEGGKEMSAADFLRGHPLPVGARFQ